MKTRVLFPFIALLFLISGSANGVCASPFREPWGEHGPYGIADCGLRIADLTEATFSLENRTLPPASPERKLWSAGRKINPLRSFVKVYRNYISPIDGKTCPMYPSCSKYSLLCFEKYGLFVGWVMTCDRLLHEADEMRKAPVIYVNGVERFYDPLENNDFWWHSER